MANSIGRVRGNAVYSSRGNRKYRIAKGGEYDSRKINRKLVEYRLVEPLGERPSGLGSGAIKHARIIKVLK